MIPDYATLYEWRHELGILSFTVLAIAFGWMGRGLLDERRAAKLAKKRAAAVLPSKCVDE